MAAPLWAPGWTVLTPQTPPASGAVRSAFQARDDPMLAGLCLWTVWCVRPSARGPRPRTGLSALSHAGTEKVRQAQECGRLHVVNPDWLWSCLERWDRVEEQLFPLSDDYGKAPR